MTRTGETPAAPEHRVIRKAEVWRVGALVVAIVAVIGVLLIQLVQHRLAILTELAQTNPQLAGERIAALLQFVLASMVLFALVIGSWMVWYGVRVVRSACSPPPGSWIVEGQPVRTGTRARRLGWLQVAGGIVVPMLACYAVYRAWALLQLI